jgi:murein DD-endopeptidase MepM/ murein hydrolase activator NlpD
MARTSGSAVFSEERPRGRAPALLTLGFAAVLVAGLVGHHQGLRIVQIDTTSSTSDKPALIHRSELARIEQQYQERLEALRSQLQEERVQMREAQRAHAAEIAAFHQLDKTLEVAALRSQQTQALEALQSEKDRVLESLQSEKARVLAAEREAKVSLERKLQAQIASLSQERDRLQKQSIAQAASIKREQDKLEQQYKRQLSELQRRLAGTVERIAQIEGAQLSLIKSLGIKADPQSRPRGGQGGTFQPLDRPRPGIEGFGSGASSLLEDLQLLERGIAPIERVWRQSLMPLTQRPVALPLQDPFYISSHFGLRTDPLTRRASRHEGVDLVARHGAPVLATAAGRVTRSGPAGPHGQLVEIDHDNGYMTRYAHLSQRTVQVGQRVELGQLLGRVGRTGRATGVHLHYELVHNGKTIDPTRAFGQKLWAEHDRQSFSYR